VKNKEWKLGYFSHMVCVCVLEFYNVTTADSEQRQSELLHRVTHLTQFIKVDIVFVVFVDI